MQYKPCKYFFPPSNASWECRDHWRSTTGSLSETVLPSLYMTPLFEDAVTSLTQWFSCTTFSSCWQVAPIFTLKSNGNHSKFKNVWEMFTFFVWKLRTQYKIYCAYVITGMFLLSCLKVTLQQMVILVEKNCTIFFTFIEEL